jgi:DNA-directed RNA polymerase specialized sigma24 family protein
VASSPAPTGSPEQKASMRAAERRRQAADLLRVTAAICAYTTEQIGNGMNPEEARQAVIETAGELAAVVVALRRLARLPARERAAVARLMAGRGMGTQEIAARLGVSAHTAWNYRNGRRGDGQPWAPG